MSSDVDAEAYESHNCFGVGWTDKIGNGINATFGKEYSFRFKFEAEMNDSVAVDCTFVDAEFEAVPSKPSHDFHYYFEMRS